MAQWQDLGLAKATFATLCRALDNKEWKYDADHEALRLHCGVRGDDLPMDLNFTVDSNRMLIIMTSHLPYVIPEDKRLEVAIAVSLVNNMLAHGCFDYDIQEGNIFYRMTNCFIESQVGEELFEYLLNAACHVVDEYNDKFLMLGKGMLSLEQFMQMLP